MKPALISVLCGVNLETVRKWIRDGKLKASITNRTKEYRISDKDFIEFLKKNKKKLNTIVNNLYENNYDANVDALRKDAPELYVFICEYELVYYTNEIHKLEENIKRLNHDLSDSTRKHTWYKIYLENIKKEISRLNNK